MAKNLSVNNINLRRDLTKGDDGGGKVVQGNKAAFELFVSHEKFAEPIEPAVANLHDPAPRFLVRMPFLVLGLFAPINHMRDVAVRVDNPQGLRAAISGVGAQVLATPYGRTFALDDYSIEHLLNTLAVIDVRAGYDDRQRDATPVHQQVSLAAFFSPDPSGWGHRLQRPAVL